MWDGDYDDGDKRMMEEEEEEGSWSLWW